MRWLLLTVLIGTVVDGVQIDGVTGRGFLGHCGRWAVSCIQSTMQTESVFRQTQKQPENLTDKSPGQFAWAIHFYAWDCSKNKDNLFRKYSKCTSWMGQGCLDMSESKQSSDLFCANHRALLSNRMDCRWSLLDEHAMNNVYAHCYTLRDSGSHFSIFGSTKRSSFLFLAEVYEEIWHDWEHSPLSSTDGQD